MTKKITKKQLKKLEKRQRNKLDKEWQLKVRERDGNKCIICQRTDIIHIHHLLPRELKMWRHNIDNGVCLCPNHHKFSLHCSAHRNPIVFMNWLILNKKEQVSKLLLDFYKNDGVI